MIAGGDRLRRGAAPARASCSRLGRRGERRSTGRKAKAKVAGRKRRGPSEPQIPHRDVRLPDERPRLRADGRPARAGRLRADDRRRATPTSSSSTPAACASAPRRSSTRASASSASMAAETGHAPDRRGRRLRRAAGRRALLQRARPSSTSSSARRASEAAADARRAGRATGAGRPRTSTSIPYDDVSFPLGVARRARSGQGLRHDHRGLQRVLRASASCRTRAATSACGRRPTSSPRSRQAAATGPPGGPAARADRQSLPGARRPGVRLRGAARAVQRRSTGIERIRFASPHPRHVTPRLIAAMRDLPKVCRHLHLPVQSGSTRVLAAMRRRHTREELPRAGRAAPRGHAGHRALDRYDRRLPGRDRRRTSSETLSLTAAVRYHSMFSFKYSPRPNTLALEAACPTTCRRRRRRGASSRCRRCSGRSRCELYRRRSVGATVDVLVDAAQPPARLGAVGPHERQHGRELRRATRRGSGRIVPVRITRRRARTACWGEAVLGLTRRRRAYGRSTRADRVTPCRSR